VRLRLLALAAAIAAAAAAGGCARYMRAAAHEAWVLRGGHELMVFGGPGQHTYLGCLTCDNGDADSVFASGSYEGGWFDAWIVNPKSDFVSRYSPWSACNVFAEDPPVVVDEEGSSYGRLTVSQWRSDGPTIDVVRRWILGACGA